MTNTYQTDNAQQYRGVAKPIREGDEAKAAAERVAMRQAEAIDAEFAEIRSELRATKYVLDCDLDDLRSRVEALERSWLSRALSKIRGFFKS